MRPVYILSGAQQWRQATIRGGVCVNLSIQWIEKNGEAARVPSTEPAYDCESNLPCGHSPNRRPAYRRR